MTSLVCGLHNLKANAWGCVLTIGNFDGLHHGHLVVVQTLHRQARRLNLSSCVMLFEPHPQEFFLAEKAPARLMRLREKIKIFQSLAVDKVVCLRFNKHLAEMEAEIFVKKILVDRLHVQMLIIGDDFRFGKERRGDFNLLEKLGKKYNFVVSSTPTVLFSDKRIGSSRVRDALKEGNFDLVSRLLTRPFTLSGRVMCGDQRGRLLGFPTVNIALHRLVSPLKGVFIVRVYGLGQEPINGIANCGKRPTVGGLKDLLEVHLFNFNKTIYGVRLEIEFLKKIRDEIKFTSLDALKEQVLQDIDLTRNYFEQLP
ncbi:MAG: bifunctional riboflavin kinase/FAD synthetase [Rickettsiella sp.]|nr:bifunctional riboflavin kinase/FAD synthetase [Rickettsiella sp.]